MLPNTINPQDYPCDDCNAEPGEPCRPYCTGEASFQEETRSEQQE